MLVCPRCNTSIPKEATTTHPAFDSFPSHMASCSLRLCPPGPPHATLYLPGMTLPAQCGFVCGHPAFADGCAQAQLFANYPFHCHQQFYLLPQSHQKCLLQTSGGCATVMSGGCAAVINNQAFPVDRLHNIGKLLGVSWTAEDDKKVSLTTKSALENCGWYYGAISSVHADSLLSKCAEGTFLIRDSSSVEGKYTLSIKTAKGPTSSRIEYESGQYFLSCNEQLKHAAPKFSGILELIEYYMEMGKRGKMVSQIWIDSEGNPVSAISIKFPLRKETPSLQHLCRLSLNDSTDKKRKLPNLPKNILEYLGSYPYKC